MLLMEGKGIKGGICHCIYQYAKTNIFKMWIYRGKFQGYISRTTHQQNDACYV